MANDANATIKDWSITAEDNFPKGNQAIGTNLDDQLRGIKGIVRDESLNKQWERWDLECTYVSPGFFKIKGSMTGTPAMIGRKVRIEHTAHDTFFGSIRSVTPTPDAQNVQYHTVEVTPEFSGSIYQDILEVKFGAITPYSTALPSTVRLTNKNPFYASTVSLQSWPNSTWVFQADLPDLYGHPKAGEVYYIRFNWDGDALTNIGPVYLRLNQGGNDIEIKRLTPSSTTLNPTFVALQVGDIARNQVVELVYDPNIGGTSRWQMLSPAGSVPSFAELAALFSVADSTMPNATSINKDATHCEHQGYITVFKNYVIQWALVKEIAPSSNVIVTLPKDSGVAKILAIVVTTVDLNANFALYVNKVSETQIQIFNSNGTHSLPCYAIVIARLSA